MAEIKTSGLNYIDSKKKSLVWPIIFLLLVITLTIALFSYNIYIQKKVDDFITKTSDLHKTINNINSKKEVQVYTLIESNKNIINELEKRSKITEYMKHMDSLVSPKKYNINFEGFSINKGKIMTSISTQSTLENNSTGSLAYEKTVNFIRNYRKDPEALLNLDFVGLVEWMDNMKYNITFSIK